MVIISHQQKWELLYIKAWEFVDLVVKGGWGGVQIVPPYLRDVLLVQTINNVKLFVIINADNKLVRSVLNTSRNIPINEE